MISNIPQEDNLIITDNYYNFIKQISEDYLKYIINYKIATSEYLKKITTNHEKYNPKLSDEIIKEICQEKGLISSDQRVYKIISIVAQEFLEDILKNTSLRDHLEELTLYYRNELKKNNFDIIDSTHPIVPIMLYDEKLAVAYAKKMMEKGIYVVAFSYPVVPKGKARIRTQVSAAHSKEDIDYIVKCFIETRDELKEAIIDTLPVK